jgi:CheY-like chemotaxis protein
MMMPVMDGWAFLEAQKSDHVLAKLPVVVVSALSAAKALANAAPSDGSEPVHAVGYLRKPIAYDALMEVVEQHCGKGDRELARRALTEEAAVPSIRLAELEIGRDLEAG